eukprot:1523938-Prorocentrum_lima.AAC.1
MASSQSARSPKAVKRIYPSPLGPKPTPGDVPLNLVHWRRFHIRFSGMRSPSSVAAVSYFGTTVYPQRTPVNPAVFEKLRNSIATFFAPFIS